MSFIFYFCARLIDTCASVSPLALNVEMFPRVTTVVDASLATARVPLATRALSTSQILFLSGPDILAYLHNLGTAVTEVHEVDFVALKSETMDIPAYSAQACGEEGKEGGERRRED